MTYEIKYRKAGRLLWKAHKRVIGHFHDHQSVESLDANGNKVTRQPQDKMNIYFEDGSLVSIPDWTRYEMKLGTDWVLFNKKEMEKKAGQPVSLNVDAERVKG